MSDVIVSTAHCGTCDAVLGSSLHCDRCNNGDVGVRVNCPRCETEGAAFVFRPFCGVCGYVIPNLGCC